MICRLSMAVLLVALPTVGLAQQPDSAARREAEERVVRETVQQQRRQMVEQRLRSAIQERFTQRVATELELQDRELAQLKATNAQFATQRAELERSLVEMRLALRRELRPGVAADEDSVARLVRQLSELQVQRAKIQQDELRQLATFLTPVQQARYLVMQQRLKELVERAVERRAAQRGHSSPE